MRQVNITHEEEAYLRKFKRLAQSWPQSLTLYSWAGALVVLKDADDGIACVIDGIDGIPNDGGDPDDVDQEAELNWLPAAEGMRR